MKKRFLPLLMALLLFCSTIPSTCAENGERQLAAETLHSLGLFRGTGTNPDGTPIFDLDKKPTRDQGLIMLIRLLGKEQEALAGTWDIPFTDVPDFMRPYVGYAYANGLTNGTSATTYGGSDTIQTTHYVVFILRALGYKDDVDFRWDNVCDFADELLLFRGDPYTPSTPFYRGDVALLSKNALTMRLKDSETRLIQQVCDKPLDSTLPVTQDSFCFFFPYPEENAGDVFATRADGRVAHGNPHSRREFTLIINGSIVTEGYTVSCSEEGFCDRLRILDNGHFEVYAPRTGSADILVTYGDVTTTFTFIAF